MSLPNHLDERARLLNRKPRNAKGKCVIYLMQTYRRLECNHALQLAALHAHEQRLPLVIVETLFCDEPWMSERIAAFICQGATETAAQAKSRRLNYFFVASSGHRELEPLLSLAASVVTDDYPTRPVQARNQALARKLRCPLYAVDSNGIIPLNRFPKEEFAARTLRPKLHRLLPEYWNSFEEPALPKLALPPDLQRTFLKAAKKPTAAFVASLPIDHSVRPSPLFQGGRKTALRRLDHFLRKSLLRYASCRNDPNEDCASELSPYLRHGFLSPLEVALAVAEHHEEGSEGAQAFLEELIVRRELSFNFTARNSRHDSWAGLPAWAIKTLEKHTRDQRGWYYGRTAFEKAETGDDLWNAAQLELLETGKIHNYPRMYWGKMFLAWSRNPRQALRWCLELNNKYALDGGDPNSYAGVLWCFGKHDRPWGPERPVFGLVRIMTRSGMERKFDVPAYIKKQKARSRSAAGFE